MARPVHPEKRDERPRTSGANRDGVGRKLRGVTPCRAISCMRACGRWQGCLLVAVRTSSPAGICGDWDGEEAGGCYLAGWCAG